MYLSLEEVLAFYIITSFSSSYFSLSLDKHKQLYFFSNPQALTIILLSIKMSSSRRSRQAISSSRISDDQITDLISKLRQSIPEIRQNRGSSTVSASKVLQETCNYIRNLNKEADDLSDRLSQLLETIDPNSPQAAIIRSLINE
ncbi:hypothetical protein N665_0787s0001 [Sinapis alba]|nr:hypothetical protein N665_0787s0001 [Sinapis alba]